MAQNLVQKILSAHLVSGKAIPGEEIGLKMDQTLVNDMTGPMVHLQFEAIGLPRIQCELSVAYVDRNTMQTSHEQADDQRFLQTSALRFGIHFSRAGNGTCQQVHLERFAVPGKTLLGADAHTCTSGALAMLAMGAAGVDVAIAMAGAPFALPMPRIVGIALYGRLGPWVSAKDIALEVVRRLTARGAVGKILEFHGDGLAGLTVPERATIANMAAEAGAVTAVFPSDQQTRRYLEAQGRGRYFVELGAEPGCTYDEDMAIDLDPLEPLIARPGSPDDVVPVREVAGTPVDQALLGSCVDSGYPALHGIAALFEGKHVHERVSAALSPGSRQVLEMLARSGDLAAFVGAGWRILESACGPCLGFGQAPTSGGVSIRSFNRNGRGRSGTPDDAVYLASSAVVAAAALTGQITDPRALGIDPPRTEVPERYHADDLLISPPGQAEDEIVRGPRIKALPASRQLGTRLEGPVLLLLGDEVSVEAILAAGPRLLALRTHVQALSEHLFFDKDASFAARTRAAGGGFLVAGRNFGHGANRELAAMALSYLGVGAVVARDFARVFRFNLVQAGILPLNLSDPEQAGVDQGDRLELPDLLGVIRSDDAFCVRNLTRGTEIRVRHGLSERHKEIVLAGGLLEWARRRARIPAII